MMLLAAVVASACGGGRHESAPTSQPAQDGASGESVARAASTAPAGAGGAGMGPAESTRASSADVDRPAAAAAASGIQSGARTGTDAAAPTAGAGPDAARRNEVLLAAAQTIAGPQFSTFRTLAEPYIAIVREMRPLDERFAAGTITPAERERYWALDSRKSELWAPLHEYMFESRWSKEDRRAMGQWLMLRAGGLDGE